jgi:hypothetical protein
MAPAVALSFTENVQTAPRLAPQGQRCHQYREVLVASRHRAVPFADNKNAKGMDMKTASVVCKFPSTPKGITKAYTAERVSFALQAWGKERASPIKCIRRFTGVDRKTAEAWWHGRNPPQTDHLLNLARNIPELKSEVRRLLELEQDQAEAFQREAIALLQRYAR